MSATKEAEADRFRIPKEGETVILDAEPLAVGLHTIAEKGDVFRVTGREIGKGGMQLKVRREDADDGQTFRLGFQHVAPTDG